MSDAFIESLVFNDKGLISVIIQDINTNKVLMLAWMNEESISKTLLNNEMWYWSRSRQKLWKKGEQSGNTQKLIEMYYDCDKDCLLARIIQKGTACHTGNETCFYRNVELVVNNEFNKE